MITAVLLVTATLFAPAQQDTSSPAARRVLADVRFLADDRQEGRGVGTAGLERSGAYIRDAFTRAGVPAAFQDFTIPRDAPAALHSNLGGVVTRNVVAIIPGRSPALRGELVVIGAHYDHLGMGGFGALDPDSTGRVHNGADDNAVFFATHHPVLHFFTDLHEDYHRSTDDWQKLNYGGIAQISRFVADLGWTLANRPGSLTFVDAPRPQATTGGSGYGAYLGTIPDMTGGGVSDGVRINGVRAGSPAEQAGLKAGDVIMAIGSKHIGNLYDMTDALRSHQAGDTVVIVSKRDGVERRATA